MHTIPVTDVRPGLLVDTRNATPHGPVIRVGATDTYAGVTYLVRRDPGALVPQGYRFAADQLVTVYDQVA